jgi:hypothetical protein
VDIASRAAVGACVVALVLSAALPARAQLGGAPTGGGQPGLLHQRGGGGRSGSSRQPAAPPPLPLPPETWPRLDPGATLCDTEAALQQYQKAQETASANGGAVLPAGCSRVTEPMAVTIVQRDGPSRESVKSTTPPGHNGWTNAWLPETRP